MGRVGIELTKGRSKRVQTLVTHLEQPRIKDKHQICRDFELSLQNQIKQLKADKKALKQLARNLYRFVVHDSCAAEHNDGSDDDGACDCGLVDAELQYRRLVR